MFVDVLDFGRVESDGVFAVIVAHARQRQSLQSGDVEPRLVAKTP